MRTFIVTVLAAVSAATDTEQFGNFMNMGSGQYNMGMQGYGSQQNAYQQQEQVNREPISRTPRTSRTSSRQPVAN